MKIKDHFLSQQIFEVKPSKHKGILQTFPQPSKTDLPKYYDSPEYISHQTQAKSLKDKIYHKVKSFMIYNKKKMVLKHHQQGRILDIGAGTGEFLDAFDHSYWEKFSIEPSEKLQSNLFKKGIKLVNDFEQLDDQSFEVITLWHSLEHIPDLELTVRQVRRILKPNGVLFIAVPNHKSYDAQFYGKYWAAWDVPRHLWHFSKVGLKSLFSKNDISCIKDRGMFFDAFYVSMLSSQYQPKSNLFVALCIASLSNLKALFNKEYSSIIYVLKPII